MIKRCACCGKPFESRPQVFDQAFCSEQYCQRTRKRQWHQAKLQSDPDYRFNQRAAQQAWSQRNQDYWRKYRNSNAEPTARAGKPKSRKQTIAKMDVWPLFPSGVYRITQREEINGNAGVSWVVEITPM
ncbi:MAG: hypothetical protein ACRETW_04095 [Stenotrophobium sp.]